MTEIVIDVQQEPVNKKGMHRNFKKFSKVLDLLNQDRQTFSYRDENPSSSNQPLNLQMLNFSTLEELHNKDNQKKRK